MLSAYVLIPVIWSSLCRLFFCFLACCCQFWSYLCASLLTIISWTTIKTWILSWNKKRRNLTCYRLTCWTTSWGQPEIVDCYVTLPTISPNPFKCNLQRKIKHINQRMKMIDLVQTSSYDNKAYQCYQSSQKVQWSSLPAKTTTTKKLFQSQLVKAFAKAEGWGKQLICGTHTNHAILTSCNEQNIVRSKTLLGGIMHEQIIIGRKLFEGHAMGS